MVRTPIVQYSEMVQLPSPFRNGQLLQYSEMVQLPSPFGNGQLLQYSETVQLPFWHLPLCPTYSRPVRQMPERLKSPHLTHLTVPKIYKKVPKKVFCRCGICRSGRLQAGQNGINMPLWHMPLWPQQVRHNGAYAVLSHPRMPLWIYAVLGLYHILFISVDSSSANFR